MKKLDQWLTKEFPGKNSPKRNFQKKDFQKKPGIRKLVSARTALPKAQFKPSKILQGKLKVIPLGGLNEVGKNMMVFEYEQDIIVVDMGLEFPSEDMLGIDYVIPDVSYLENNKKRIRAVIITHGHLDHIGGIPYILPKLDFPPIFATKLTIGLIGKKIEEFGLQKFAKLNVVDPKDVLKLGKFKVEFFRAAHSIPDAVGVIIDTPIGKLVHTGDFKFDDTPSTDKGKADLNKIQSLGSQNVLALFSDSTNALKKGHTKSEEFIGLTLEEIIQHANNRVIIASFSSLIGRIQQIIEIAVKYNRKVFVSGKSMRDNIEIARKLGYLNFPKDSVLDIRKYKNVPDNQALILTTGSQGEAVSALARIANKEHKNIKVKKGDLIILSSKPIIGNERAIVNVINKLCILGAEVIDNEIMDVHTSGHGRQDELKRMIDLVRPKYFIPVHGEYYMRQRHGVLAREECGVPENKILMLQNGDVLLADRSGLQLSPEKIETKYVLIDGRGEGHVGSQVQVERENMSLNGALILIFKIFKKTHKLMGHVDVISKGFIYMHESDEVTREVSQIAEEAYRRLMSRNPHAPYPDIKKYIQQSVDHYTHEKLERSPLIVPLIVEV